MEKKLLGGRYRIDALIGRAVDVWMSFPPVILSLILMVGLGVGVGTGGGVGLGVGVRLGCGVGVDLAGTPL